MHPDKRITYLLSRYRAKLITAPELDELLIWLYDLDDSQSEALAEYHQPIWEEALAGTLNKGGMQADSPAISTRIAKAQKATTSQRRSIRMHPFRIAAAVLIALAVWAAIHYLHIYPTKHSIKTYSQPATILPNSNPTVLELGDGRQIILDSVTSGNLFYAGGVQVMKQADGLIQYQEHPQDQQPTYHTITVPKGGRPYLVELSDGSRVWLNAASSLHYPTYFRDQFRQVTLSGEGYFEIARLDNQPFRVETNELVAEVLGTEFNVNAYQDEAGILTTLLNGSVQIKSKKHTALLKPGQQLIYKPGSGEMNISVARTDIAIAWVKGYFQFDRADLQTILRQVGRWYDLDIEFHKEVHQEVFSGKIERSLPLNAILRLLEQGNIHVKIEGKKLIVL